MCLFLFFRTSDTNATALMVGKSTHAKEAADRQSDKSQLTKRNEGNIAILENTFDKNAWMFSVYT
jgi:hypothetical protein